MAENPKRRRTGEPEPGTAQRIDFAEIPDLTVATCFGNRRGIAELCRIDPDDTFLQTFMTRPPL
jgi:hypothetical protein